VAKSETRSKSLSKAEPKGRLSGPAWKRRPDYVPGYTFEQHRADRVVRFVQQFVTMTTGRQFAGKPMRLMPWQIKEIIEPLYGWVDSDGLRRYRRAAIFIGKKNGKSSLMAALVLYHLLADSEPGASVYGAAVDRLQAGLIYRDVAASVRANPELSRVLEVIDSRSTIVHKPTASRYTCLAADSWRAEGINASAVIVDELHAHRKPDLVRALVYAGAARQQPLCVAISTAGDDRTGIGYEWWEDAMRVDPCWGGDPNINPTFFGRVYAAKETDDYASPKTWKKANPSMGVTIDPKAFANEYKDATTSPGKLGSFLRYRLNVWSDIDRKFFDPARWQACDGDPGELAGRAVWVGIDLASNIDMTSAAFVSKNEDGTYAVHMKYWVPSESVGIRERDTGFPYTQWVRDGLLTVTDGARLDHERVAADIIAIGRECQIVQVGTDPWQAGPLATFLQREGIEVQVVRQNTSSLNAPSKYLEGIVAEKRLHHGGHPILTMNALNTVMYTDATGMVKPDKRNGKMIDGVIALINALALATVAEQTVASWDIMSIG